MTIIDTVSTSADRESSFADERLRQEDAARDRMAQRHSTRIANEEALRGPDGRTSGRPARRFPHLRFSRHRHTLPKQLERIINAADFLSVRYLDDGVSASRSIGRVHIDVSSGEAHGFGTGFLVAPSLLLTNHHVLPDAETAPDQFRSSSTIRTGPAVPHCPARDSASPPDRFFLADRQRDFALLAVDAPLSELGERSDTTGSPPRRAP